MKNVLGKTQIVMSCCLHLIQNTDLLKSQPHSQKSYCEVTCANVTFLCPFLVSL